MHATQLRRCGKPLKGYNRGESLKQRSRCKDNLFWYLGKFTSRDGEQRARFTNAIECSFSSTTLQPDWGGIFSVICDGCQSMQTGYRPQSHISKLFDVLKQFQNEVNDIRSERLARSANPLALLAAANHIQITTIRHQNLKGGGQRSNAPSYMQSSSTRPSASTRHKGKEIAKPVTPQSESVSEEDSDPEQARRDKDMKKNLALLAKYFKKLYKPTNNNLRTSSNSRNKTEDTTPRYKNDNHVRAVWESKDDDSCWG
ncbi:hypothetical protein Tco_1193114 [Tanacetum coccineum]